MTRMLSQEEIDALLSAISSGQRFTTAWALAKQKAITLYDFKRPERLSKDQLRTLRTIHEAFARSFGIYLSNVLRTLVEMSVTLIDQLTYSEFTMAMAAPTCLYVFESKGLEGSGILEISPELTFFIIDRLMGGKGGVIDEPREVTIIEQNMMHKIVTQALQDLEEAWKNVIPLGLELKSFEVNPMFVQIAPAGETVVVITLEVKIKNFTSPVSICFPYFILEPIAQKLTIKRWISVHQRKGERVAVLQEEVKAVEVPVVVNLGDVTMTVRELLGLRVGDVINLNKEIDENATISIAGKDKFYAVLGVRGRKMAAKIVQVI